MNLSEKNITFSMVVVMVIMMTACTPLTNDSSSRVPGSAKELILATTTSTENSGLLDFILSDFQEKYGIDVKVVAVGSGAALQMGKDGEADVILAHAKTQEEELVAAGHGLERFDVMYNDFIIIGPKDDPADLMKYAAGDVLLGLQRIADTGSTFVSRGDNSGTHIMEGNLWREIGMEEPTDGWYISSGQGMGDVILMANELEGYTLTDRATYLSMKQGIMLDIMVEGDPELLNYYGVTAVNPEKGDHINGVGAALFLEWILSEETQQLISTFGVEEFGTPLFFPNAE